ncbi:MAG: hypothetical protein ACR2P2_07725 [Nakamurella sp.]
MRHFRGPVLRRLALTARAGALAGVLGCACVGLAACAAPPASVDTSAHHSASKSASATASPTTASPTTAATRTVTHGPTVAPVDKRDPDLAPFTGAETTSPPRSGPLGTAGHPIEVRATGAVLATASGSTQICPPYPHAAQREMAEVSGASSSTAEEPTPDCTDPVPVTGIDMTKVAMPGHNSSHRWGMVTVSGSWDGAVLHVTSQRPATPNDQQSFDGAPPDTVSCAAPASGWKPGMVQNDPGIGKIEKTVGPDVGQLAIGHPDGTTGPGSTTQVLVVGVTGDLDDATTAIRGVFRGNLCVVHAENSASEVARQRELLATAIGNDWSRLHLMLTSDHTVRLGEVNNEVSVAYETQALRDVLAKVPGPTITVNAWLNPVG